MIKFYFFMATFLGGLLVHIVFDRYLSIAGISPDVLLLMVIAAGFMLGPMMGELFGFFWGLVADALGVSLFGANTLLLVLIGYTAGKLRHNIDSERPAPQVVIALLATCLYLLSLFLIQTGLEEFGSRIGILQFFVKVSFNGLLAPAVFWVMERWITVWRVHPEH